MAQKTPKIVKVRAKKVQKVKAVRKKVAAEQVSDLKARVLQEVQDQQEGEKSFQTQFLAKKT